jgi:anti-sigma factor RsiW
MRLTCKQIFLRLSEYLDGDLPPDLCEEIQRHLAVCPACRAFTNTLRATIELCGKLPPVPIPPDLRRKLRAALRAHLAQVRGKTA